MRQSWFVLILTIVLSLAGAVVSFNLTVKHQVKTTGLAWFDTTCEGGDQSARSCDQVMATKWGYLPPIPRDAGPEERGQPVSVLGLFEVRPRPSALWGLFYFSALAAWYVAIGRPSHSRRFYHLIPLLVNVAGVAGALFFVYVMFTTVDAWCPWCMVTHTINGLMLVGAVLLWPRRPAPAVVAVTADLAAPLDEPAAESSAAGPPTAADEGPAPTPAAQPQPPAPAQVTSGALPAPAIASAAPRAHPYFRLVAVTLGAIVAIVLAEDYFNTALTKAKLYAQRSAEFAKLKIEMQKVQADAQILYSMYINGPKHEIPRRDDDPVINQGPNRLSLVVFSDFQCPHCGRFAKKLNEEIAPLFDGHLRITFKHFPASPKCNRYVKRDVHPQACSGSMAAEAARKLGENEAFWQAHDLLFASPKELGRKEFQRSLAEKLALDPDEFIETLNAEDLKARLQEDIELAKKVGVDATPAVFVAGRRVPRIAMLRMHYWKMVAKNFQVALQKKQAKKAQAHNQVEQRSRPQRATPDTPGP